MPATKAAEPLSMVGSNSRITAPGVLRWVSLADLIVDERTQRDLREGWVRTKMSEYNPSAIGHPLVNRRPDGVMSILDGQHRIELLRALGLGERQIQVEMFEGLTLPEEAALFLMRNSRIGVRPMDNFRVRLTALDEVACDIMRIVQSYGLTIASGPVEGYINAVNKLEHVYNSGKSGPWAMSLSLKCLLQAFGRAHTSFEGTLVEGLGLFFARYGSAVDPEYITNKMTKAPGGAAGLIGLGRTLRQSKGRTAASCQAGAFVDLYNKGRRGSGKLESWF